MVLGFWGHFFYNTAILIMKYKNLHDIYTYQCHRNEVYLGGKDEDGKDFTIVFDTIELIFWLDIPYMKEQAIKHIKEIGEVPNKINPKMKLSKKELGIRNT